MYGSFNEMKKAEDDQKERGDYASAPMDEPVTSVKLVPIKLTPNDDYDEEDSSSLTPMMKKNSVSPLDEQEPLKAEDDGGDDASKSLFDPFSESLKELVGNLTVDENSQIDDDASADMTLLQAAAEGEINIVKQCVEALKNIPNKKLAEELDLCDTNGHTALHMAARYNRKNVVNYLIDNDANMNITDQQGLTPLHLATKYNMTATAKCLIQKSADVNVKTEYGTTCLFFAARRGNQELVALLLDAESLDVNHCDNSSVTALHAAMVGGNEEVVRLLIDRGANIRAINKEREMPIHFAAEENHSDLIIRLTKGVLKDCQDETEKIQIQREFINVGNSQMDTALHIAAQNGLEETVKTLIPMGAMVNAKNDTRQTPLHLAAIGGHLSVVKFLIMNHAKVNATDGDQMTPLHNACQFGRLDTCKFLLNSGAKMNLKDCDNFTALMLAVWKGQNEIVEFLIGEGADINVTDSTHAKTLLHLAIEEDEGETLSLLFQKGAKDLINTGDKDYRTPLHYAAKVGNEEAVEMLLNLNADIDATDNEEKNPIHVAAEYGEVGCVKLLGEYAPGSINYSSETGKSPLHFAAMKGHKLACAALMEMGAEISARDDVNWTPLDYAAYNGYHKVLLLLLDNDAPVDACDSNKSTPLHHASGNGHVDCVGILLNYKASISHKNSSNKNCLDLAVENGQVDVCRALVTHERWKEVMRAIDNDGYHPMEKLIAVAPTVAQIVLDKCVETTKADYESGGKTVRVDKTNYNFEFLDIRPEHQVNKLFFAPHKMVKHQREKLLSHRLTVKLINDKWARLGRWIYIMSLSFYLLFLALLTALLIMDKERSTKITNERKTSFEKATPWLTLLLAVGQIGKELSQMYYLKWKYFKEFVNYLELVLYLTTILFMLPFLAENLDDSISAKTNPWKDIKWNAAAIAILLAWGNLLLYLKRFPFFGLYVVMFTEVFTTLVSVLCVFSIFIVGFGLSFYVLLDIDQGFKYVGRSIIKTGVMTLGEFEFTTIMTEHFDELPYKALTYIIFTVFLCLMPILIMNFLVGLAVGDIEAVRKNAYLRILKAQVQILRTIEESYPTWLLHRVYKSHHVELSKHKKSLRERIVFWFSNFGYDSVVEEQEDIGNVEHQMTLELEANSSEIEKQKKRLKNVVELLDEQKDMLTEICEKLNVSMEN